MVATALVVLAVAGVVVAWDRQLPRPPERLPDLSGRRRVLAALGVPVGLAAALSAGLVLLTGSFETFAGAVSLLLAAVVGAGGVALAVLTVVRLGAAGRRHR